MAARPIDRIAVAGAGAIGGWVAAKLALAGHRVSAFGRGGAVDTIRLVETGNARDAQLEQASGPADLLIVAVKAPALADAAQAARRLIGPDTLILPMLNGVPWWFVPGEPLQSVDPDGSVGQSLPFDQVIGCVVHAACRRSGPAEVTVVHADRLILGEPGGGGTSDRVAELAALFEGAGIRSEQSDDVRSEIWYKLWGNATINPLSALTRATADRLHAEPHLRQFMLDAMEELAAVGAAIGCPISESGEDRMAVTQRLGAFKTSMLQDVEAGRPMELEALLGAPREIARRAGIATPKLDQLYAQTRLLGESLNLL
jgi:2-dehydropantoate 2-reductase